MKSNRDDFTAQTKDSLAKRSGYKCSNPACRKQTIGAHEIPTKSVSIGIAAHISAAAPGGARYNSNFTPDERSHIDNGIWLCSNCSALVDKDEIKFPSELLRKWKVESELNSQISLSGDIKTQLSKVPILDLDLIWHNAGSANIGVSQSHPVEFIDGQWIRVVDHNSVFYYRVYWSYYLKVINNSSYPVINLKCESIGSTHFTELTKIAAKGNIPPLKELVLDAKYETIIEGPYKEIDEIKREKIPSRLNGLILKFTFLNEERSIFHTYLEFRDGQVEQITEL